MVERNTGLCLDLAFGWRAVCPHSVGPRGHLLIGLCGLPCLPDCYLVLMNITSTVMIHKLRNDKKVTFF